MDRLNYHHLYLFWILAREGSFTKASAALSIAQSAVTSQIKNLEDSLNLSLVDRSNRRKTTLTDDGRAVLEYASAIFESGDELLKWASRSKSHRNEVLKIGALSGLSRNLQFEFLKPVIGREEIRVEVTTGDQEKLVRLLKEHYLDLILSSHNVAADGRITLHSNVLMSSPLVFVIAGKAKIKGGVLADYLAQKKVYLPSRSFETRPEIDAYLDRFKAPSNVAGEIDDIALLRIFAVKSECLVLMPEMGVRSEILSGEVKIVARPKGLTQKFYVITRQKRNPNQIAEMLIERMKKI